ncbi:MAG: hypothetical protein A4E58_00006 [Syntrophorhabdus sp. PtaB.Bin006]|nr:MAG: hypothetical protein A4E58_00006 [Syntrophorhabdus sp. PtaB.Bin006]
MKTLSNSRGISLVVLIVAMTLIMILGVSFVSIMASKQKGFLYQVDSYRALNIANAGVEYAIRCASDGLDSNGNSIFFSDQGLSTLGRSLGGGTFSINYAYSQTIDADLLTATGTYGTSSRQVRLSRFRRYLSPITLVPGNQARVDQGDSSQVLVPVICNEGPLIISRLDVTVSASNVYLKVMRAGVNLFDYNSSIYPECGAAICKINDAPNEQRILFNGGTVRFDLLSAASQHNQDEVSVYVLKFSGSAPMGQYRIDFFTSFPNGNPFSVIFSLHP